MAQEHSTKIRIDVSQVRGITTVEALARALADVIDQLNVQVRHEDDTFDAVRQELAGAIARSWLGIDT